VRGSVGFRGISIAAARALEHARLRAVAARRRRLAREDAVPRDRVKVGAVDHR
jgi:hypothetical protein